MDRLIQLGVLPEPEEYHVWWPDLTSQTAQEKAQVALIQTQPDQTYIAGGVENLIPPMDYLTRTRGFTKEEAEAMMEEAEKIQEENAEEEALKMEEQRMAMIEMAEKSGQVPNDQGTSPFGKKPSPFPPKSKEEEEVENEGKLSTEVENKEPLTHEQRLEVLRDTSKR